MVVGKGHYLGRVPRDNPAYPFTYLVLGLPWIFPKGRQVTGTEIFLALALKGAVFTAFSIISEKRERRARSKHSAKPATLNHLISQRPQVFGAIKQRPRYRALPSPRTTGNQ